MPLINQSNYVAPSAFYKNPHISTIYIGRFKKTIAPKYVRKRLELKDGDFLDIDYLFKNPKKAVILCHGLEGASNRTYNNTSVDYFLKNDFSVFACKNRSFIFELILLPILLQKGEIEVIDIMSIIV